MRNIILILVSLLTITLFSCAHIDNIYTISDIKGTWEATQFGYFFLDIRENGQGYLGFSIDVQDIEFYKITNIRFLKGKFILTFQNYDDSEELLNLEGFLFGNDILIFNEFENMNNEDSKNPEEYLIFLRESIVPELKKSVKEKLK